MNPSLVPGIALGLAATVASALIVRGVRAYALRQRWLDVPNPRSSHEAPVPRGGGAGFVVAALVFLAVVPLVPRAGMPVEVAWPALAAVGGVAVVGWIDDRRGLSIAPRLAVHIAAGALLAWSAQQMDATLGLLPYMAAAWWVIWTVSTVNVVNFMDGIDGLVGLQAVIYGGFLALALPDEDPWFWLAIVTFGAVIGFLRYNWPPASIFMGDVGSGALGTIFVLLGIGSIAARKWTVLHAFLPLAPLFLDEAMTMVRRLARGERLWKPHRAHVYQRLVQAGWSHRRVTMAYGLLSALGATLSLTLPRATPPFFLTALTLLVASAVTLLVLGDRADRMLGASGGASTEPGRRERDPSTPG